MTTNGRHEREADLDDAVVVVSCDSHVGPLLEQQLRAYCPQRHLAAFDDFVAQQRAAKNAVADGFVYRDDHPNTRVAGHHDVHARIRDMDREGIAAEVIYHFSKNGEPLPLVPDPAGGLGTVPADHLEMGAVGLRIYNRWLAEFVSVEPERHIGLAYLPMWDVDAAVAELEWAAEAGLRGVNFPPPGRVGHLEYNHPAWEPFWAACAATGMSLHTHSSGGGGADYFSGPGGQDILVYECGGWMARRAAWWLTHGRVFERHPSLRLVITEQYEGWWSATLAELDAVYERFSPPHAERLPEPPSAYLRRNVLLGASFMSTHLAEDASRNGYERNVLWGRDYPHDEGTFQVFGDGQESISRLSLRHVLSRVPPAAARLMAGENAVRELGLDGPALQAVARRIGAPTGRELATPPESLPAIDWRSNAFRGQAGARL